MSASSKSITYANFGENHTFMRSFGVEYRYYIRFNNHKRLHSDNVIAALFAEVTHWVYRRTEKAERDYREYVKLPRDEYYLSIGPIDYIAWGPQRDKAYELYKKAAKPKNMVSLECLCALMAPYFVQKAYMIYNKYVPFEIASLVADFL